MDLLKNFLLFFYKDSSFARLQINFFCTIFRAFGDFAVAIETVCQRTKKLSLIIMKMAFRQLI